MELRPLHVSVPAVALMVACSHAAAIAPGDAGSGSDGSADAISDVRSEALPDVTLDSPPADAPLEAPVGDAGPWCASQVFHLFCDDFDEGPLMQAWDGTEAQHGTVQLDGKTYTSPLESFLATTTPLGAGAVAAVGLSKQIAFTATEMHLAYDLHVDAIDSSGVPMVVSSLQMLDTLSEVLETIEVSVSSSGASVNDYAPSLDGGVDFSQSYPISGPRVGQWTRIKIDLVLPFEDGGTGDGTLTVHVGDDPTPIVDQAAMSPVSQPSQPYVYLGVVYASGPSQAFAVRFDDVTFDVEP